MSVELTLRQTKIRHLQLKEMVCVAPDTSLGETIATMQRQRNGCALVVVESSLMGARYIYREGSDSQGGRMQPGWLGPADS